MAVYPRHNVCSYTSAESSRRIWQQGLKTFKLISAAPRATLSLLSCPPNFPRAPTTRNTHAKHGSILHFLIALNSWFSVDCQLISEVDIFDVVSLLWGFSLSYYSHIYTFFCLQLSWPTCPIWTRFQKLNCELPIFPLFLSTLFSYFLFYCKTNYHLVMHRGEPEAGSTSVVKCTQISCGSITRLINC